MLFHYHDPGKQTDTYVNLENVTLVEVFAEDNLVINYTSGIAMQYHDRAIIAQLVKELQGDTRFVQMKTVATGFATAFVNFRNCPRIVIERPVKPEELQANVYLTAARQVFYRGENAKILAEKMRLTSTTAS
jgi:hypothetical protein